MQINIKFKEIGTGLNTYRLLQDSYSRDRILHIALGHALATVAPIPSGIENGEAYFNTNIRSVIGQIAASINEIRLVDIDAVITHARNFWQIRVATAFPSVCVPDKELGFFESSNGSALYLPSDVREILRNPTAGFDILSISNFIRLKLEASGEAFGTASNSVVPVAMAQAVIGG